ncbi:MAG: M15 family metallopeptidase [Prevotella sp.]|nr:M15 family metallopeptidase [Candidatus Prevotella equi]
MKKIAIILFLCLAATVSWAQKAGTVLPSGASHKGFFTQQEIPDDVFRRMQGKSFAKGCTTKRSDLRYLRLLHCNMNGDTQVGEMVCHRTIAAALIDIFRALYESGYRIERMVLIDDYDADDERSMSANNTSCFNFRFMTGSRTRVSLHGRGLAVDINPRYNPYINKKGKVSPINGKAYAYNRTSSTLGNVKDVIIRRGDICHRLFLKHGFVWGGAWKSLKDYQHFERIEN